MILHLILLFIELFGKKYGCVFTRINPILVSLFFYVIIILVMFLGIAVLLFSVEIDPNTIPFWIIPLLFCFIILLLLLAALELLFVLIVNRAAYISNFYDKKFEDHHGNFFLKLFHFERPSSPPYGDAFPADQPIEKQQQD